MDVRTTRGGKDPGWGYTISSSLGTFLTSTAGTCEGQVSKQGGCSVNSQNAWWAEADRNVQVYGWRIGKDVAKRKLRNGRVIR